MWHPEERKPSHLKTIYMLFTLASASRKPKKPENLSAGELNLSLISLSLPLPAEFCVKSALTWQEQAASAVSRDHPFPGFIGLIVWILLTSELEWGKLWLTFVKYLTETIHTFFRAGGDHGI